MKFPDRVHEYLTEMLVVCNQLRSFQEGQSEERFRKDIMLQYAILKALEILGEAAVRVKQESPSFIFDHSLNEFNFVIGLRNRLVHEYDNIDLGIVWKAAQESVPALRLRVLAVLNDLGHHPDPDSLQF